MCWPFGDTYIVGYATYTQLDLTIDAVSPPALLTVSDTVYKPDA